MWLINVHTLELEAHYTPPHYVILSHTWGSEEVSFQEWTALSQWERLRRRGITPDAVMDLAVAETRNKSGYLKILKICELARADNTDFAWVDTCCIDKASSSELSEAINSMYSWYQRSRQCYAFLEDVKPGEGVEALRKSRWFTRGWTLQELLAPGQVIFLNSDWKAVGHKKRMTEFLSDITGIGTRYLARRWTIREAGLAERMSWAASRETTRGEDMAYCLFGIFNIHMPLLYGEGGVCAFLRLQEEIVKKTADQSLLAWGYLDTSGRLLPRIFAPSPKMFLECGRIVHKNTKQPPFQMTNRGLQITLHLAVAEEDLVYGLLDCAVEGGDLAIPLKPFRRKSPLSIQDGDEFVKIPGGTPVCLASAGLESQRVNLFISSETFESISAFRGYSIVHDGGDNKLASGHILEEVYPPMFTFSTGDVCHRIPKDDRPEGAGDQPGRPASPTSLDLGIVFRKYRCPSNRESDVIVVIKHLGAVSWSRTPSYWSLDNPSLVTHVISRQSPRFPAISLADLFLRDPQLLADTSWWYPESQDVVVEVVKSAANNRMTLFSSFVKDHCTIYIDAKEKANWDGEGVHSGRVKSPCADDDEESLCAGDDEDQSPGHFSS